MKTLRELSQAEMKVNEAKADLSNIQESKDAFLKDRQAETVQKISDIWKESSEITNKIGQNYEQVHTFYTTVSTLASFVGEAHEKFNELVKDFNEYSEEWEKNATEEWEKLREFKKDVDHQALLVKEGQKTNARIKEENEKELGRIASRQKQIKSALEEIKKHR